MIDVPSTLSGVTVHGKYARHIAALRRRETFEEAVQRNMDFHAARFPQDVEVLREAYALVFDKRFLPSMRGMQFAGPALAKNHARVYNCSFQHMVEPKCFADLLFLLLSGCGVGYSVQRHHVLQLPTISTPLTSAPHVVADTIEGWADAALALVSAYFGQGPRPEFDYSAIRPKGAPLKTTGGRAPGPAQLALSLAACERVIVRAIERGQQRLAPIDVHDLNCHLADCVAAGGIRRSAMIALFSPDDHALLSCKSGDWWADNGQRARANNSAVLLRSATSRADFDVLMDACRDSHAGEPGIFWTHDLEIGTNPCAEISLRHRQFCNLATINAAACITQSDLEQACAAASTIATYQATLTDFVYIADEWRSVTESDALIAVSMTGIADNPAAYASWDLERAARVVVDTNRRLAAHLGIRPSARCTTGKPDGTSSLVLGCASGIHARHGAHYVRTMRFGADESIAQHLSLALPPELVEVDRQKPDGLVIGFPECAPVGSILRDEPALDLLTRTARQNLEWIKAGHNYGLNHNNQSVTVSLREHEWVPAREWLWDNRESYTGMAILPYDGGTYEQAPFQSISEARYHELMALMPLAIDLTQIVEDEDNTALVGEAACAGGACEIPQCAPQLPHAAYEVTA